MLSPALLVSISQWLTIIVGICLIAFGNFSALINLVIFSRRRLRNLSSTQYILLQSFFDIIILTFILMIQVAVYGFSSSYFLSHRLVCILRNYISIFFTQTSLYCKCLIVFDIWASTSRHASIRRWSSVKRARLLLLINITVWALISTPYAIFFDVVSVRNVLQCIPTGQAFISYHGYFFLPCLTLFIPLLSFSVFGFLSYVNVTRLNALRRAAQLQHQFVRMILTQVLVTTISFIPYTAQFMYSTITASWRKDADWIAMDTIIVQTGRMCFFLNNVIAFYIYMCVSSEIRIILKQTMLNLRDAHPQNWVTPN